MDAMCRGSEKLEEQGDNSPQHFNGSQSPLSSHRSQASSFIEKMKENGEMIKIRKVSSANRRNSQMTNQEELSMRACQAHEEESEKA